MIRGLFFILILLSGQLAFAAETAKVNTEDAPTVAAGEFEFEMSYSFETADKAFDSSNHTFERSSNYAHIISAKMTHGLSDTLDFAVSWGWEGLKDNESDFSENSDLSDLVLNAKYNFYVDPLSSHYLSYVPILTLPTAEASSDAEPGPGQEFWSFDQLLVYTFDADEITVSTDLGFSIPFGEDRENQLGTFVFDIGVGYQFTETVQPVIEINAFKEFFSGEIDPYSVGLTVGAVVNINDRTRLDLGFSQVFFGREAARTSATVVNFSYTFA